MRLFSWSQEGKEGTAVRHEDRAYDLGDLPLLDLLRAGPNALAQLRTRICDLPELDTSGLTFAPVVKAPPKIVCVGMNYKTHASENNIKQQSFPTFFARFSTSLVGHGQPILRPFLSDSLDFEGEMAVIIGRPGRHIPVAEALEYVAGYSIFNEASIRDYQLGKGQQWTLGKNFDQTGAFGPDFVTADELPPGGKGLALTTRLNGSVVQSANTDDLIFDVATLISHLTEAVSLEVGDVLVTGTPGGIGHYREPKLYMKAGDVCEVEIDGIGVLRNRIEDETDARSAEFNTSEGLRAVV